MNTLGDELKEQFVADEKTARTRTVDPARTVAAIRRRRTARAAGMGTASAFGIAAVGAVWWLGPGAHFASPADPLPTATCTTSIYAPPNLEARGDLPFGMRAYVDLRTDSPDPTVVAVLADGTATEVLPNAAGDYIYDLNGWAYYIAFHNQSDYFAENALVMDYTSAGESSASSWDGSSAYVDDYKWTTVVPAHVPDDIDTVALSATLAIATLHGGVGYLSDSVPSGAYTDAVITTAKGEEVTRLKEGDPMPDIEGRTDVISAALRVGGLTGGDSFTIVSTYDANGAPPPMCSYPGPGLATATSSATPTSDTSGPSQEPGLGASEAPVASSEPGVSQGP